MLHLCVMLNAKKCAKLLLDGNINLNRRDFDHKTATDYIRGSQYAEWANILARVDHVRGIMKTEIGNHHANDSTMNRFDKLLEYRKNDFLGELIKFMEAESMDLNSRFSNGQTFLHRAVLHDCDPVSVVKTCLDNGANPELKDEEGKTPADYVGELNFNESDKSRLNYMLKMRLPSFQRQQRKHFQNNNRIGI